MINFLAILGILSVLFSFIKLWVASEDMNALHVLPAIYFLLFGVFLLLLAILIKINPFW